MHPPPAIQEVVVVRTPAGKGVEYFPDRLRVIGTMRVRETHDDGYIITVFDMTAESVTPATSPSVP